MLENNHYSFWLNNPLITNDENIPFSTENVLTPSRSTASISRKRIPPPDTKENIGLTPEQTRGILNSTKSVVNHLHAIPKSLHTYKFKKFRTLTNTLNHQIDKREYTTIVNFIKAHAADIFTEAIEKKEAQIININSSQHLIFKPSGKIYLKLTDMGVGYFNVTSKDVLFACAQPDHYSSDKLVVRAFRRPKINSSEKTQQIDRETTFNHFLKSASKSFDLSHVNIIKSISTIKGHLKGSMTRIYDGNIDQLMENKSLTKNELVNIALQMTTSISQLHSIGARHRDIKPDNFLFSRDENNQLNIVVTDFGTSTGPGELRYVGNVFHLLVRDPAWSQFEPTHPLYFSTASDIYQLGMTLCMILTNSTMQEFEQTILKDMHIYGLTTLEDWKKVPHLWSIFEKTTDPSIKTLLLRMVEPIDVESRPSIGEVLDFFRT